MSSPIHEPRSSISRLPSLDALRVFQATAHHLSFSRAAAELHVTQGAVSHRIRSLEEALGLPLFSRVGRRVELTEDGRQLLRGVDEAMAVLEQSLRVLHQERAAAPLLLSCSPSFAIRWLVPHLPALHAAAPGLDLRIQADDRLVEPGQGGIDLCIRYGPGGAPQARELRLSTERVTPVCSPLLLAGPHPLRAPADLAHQVLLHDEALAGHQGRVGWTRWLQAAGVADRVDARRGTFFSHAHLALEAALAGQGVALARGILVARDLAAGRLVAPFDLALESGLAYWLLLPRQGPLRPPVLAFRDWLLQAIARGDAP